jgi:hypothetical protein
VTSRRYFGTFVNVNDVIRAFSDRTWNEDKNDYVLENWPDIKDREVLFASYEGDPCSGCAEVLFKRGEKLYQVEAMHCSCNGLEGQWAPGETTWEAQALRLPVLRERDNFDWSEESTDALIELIESKV